VAVKNFIKDIKYRSLSARRGRRRVRPCNESLLK